ncbi:protein FAM178B isoform X3 [Mus caroli]|uniref:Protein FAM178B isoform X3 n=1 Tax=Mus caroli TaxID=10089 RepID=A0A6P5PFY7_MUSCR|nr:protein FAM178B isoform X3 [Mus caroli]
MQMPRDSFPTDWSPPPVEFLNKPKKAPPAKKGPLEDLEKDPPDPNQKVELASLEELFWNMAGPSQQAGTPEIPSGGSQCYINNLDYLLQEKREQALEQEWEQLLQQTHPRLKSSVCDDDDNNDREAALMPEHRMLVEKFSVSLQVISPVHPGETVFLPRRHPLPCFLDSSRLKPHSPLEELFLRSSLPEQLSFLHNGLLSNLYLHAADCPQPLLQWLFQLLTWPPETSSRAFGLLWDLSIDGLFRQPDEDMHFWCPSLQEVKKVFSSLGAYNPALYPQGPFQHSSRVLESEASLDSQDPPQEVALDIKLNYIYRFLILCLLVRPASYTDASILDLMELLCRAGLDVGLCLLPKSDLQQLLLLLLERIQEWPGKLQPLCCALSWVSDHHHNLLALVQFFLDVTPRGRQLRSQLSLVIIARMLGQQESLPFSAEKTQLALLSQQLSLMRPSSLRQCLGIETLPSSLGQYSKASAELDYKVCYLCHSLLTLAGVVVSSQDITPNQWGELQLLCMQLDRHISTHIRESPQAMHRTKLKDLATQTYIRWQDLLAHCQPQGQYFSPWKDI